MTEQALKNNEVGDATRDILLAWATAVLDGVHMEIDLEGLTALTPLAGDALQSAANTRANALKTAMLAHMAGVGTPFVMGEHAAADPNADTLTAVPNASGLPSCITLINALHDADNAHGVEAGVHFHDDPDEATATISVDPPVTLADCITDLNEIRQSMLDHFAKGNVAQGAIADVGGPAITGLAGDEPIDAALGPSSIEFYLDESGNKLMVKVKYSNGTTVKSGEIALT